MPEREMIVIPFTTDRYILIKIIEVLGESEIRSLIIKWANSRNTELAS